MLAYELFDWFIDFFEFSLLASFMGNGCSHVNVFGAFVSFPFDVMGGL